MRQIGGENDDPLKRIQQEINEVKQRELELRNQLRFEKQQQKELNSPESGQDSPQQQNSDDSGISTTSSSPINGTSANAAIDLDTVRRPHRFVDHNNKKQQQQKQQQPQPQIRSTVPAKKKQLTSNPTYVRSTSAAAFVFAPRNPKPVLEYCLPPSQNSGKSVTKTSNTSPGKHNQRSEKMLTRTVSTPQLFQSFQPKAPASRGFMQRFIETRGKLSAAQAIAKVPIIDNGPVVNGSLNISPTAQIAPPVRDADGKPIRKGFVPVEEKIQKELREMRHREVELKIQRQKSVQYDFNHNLVQDEECEPFTSLDYEEAGFKLRSSKSISELSDYSPRNSPSPQQFDHHQQRSPQTKSKLRPALSLAQLCDLDPESEEVVSSNRLIAQFECMIQKKMTVV